MPTPKLNITCRVEEVPAIGGFLISSLGVDLADFTAFSPDFDAAYVTAAQTQLTTVSGLIFPKELTAQLKVITLRMYTNMGVLPQKIDFLEGYIKRTTGLTVAAKDFGISAVRKARNSGDVEALVSALNFTLGLAHNATNKPLLQAKGYTVAQQNALTQIKSDLAADNTAQNDKVNARNTLVTANYGVINDFWKILVDISDAGKRIYRSSNKKDDYTIASLKRRVRNEQLKNKLAGTITFGGSPFANAKVALVPVGGGRKRSVKSKASGKYELKSLAAGDWIVTVTADGKQTITEAVTIVSGETTTRDFVLVNV